MSGYATIAESADDPTAPSVYSEISTSQMHNDTVTVSAASTSNYAFDSEDTKFSFQSKRRYLGFGPKCFITRLKR